MEKLIIGVTYTGKDSYEHAILRIHNPDQFEECLLERRDGQNLLGLGSTGTSNPETILEITGTLSLADLLSAATNAGWINSEADLINLRNYLECKL